MRLIDQMIDYDAWLTRDLPDDEPESAEPETNEDETEE